MNDRNCSCTEPTPLVWINGIPMNVAGIGCNQDGIPVLVVMPLLQAVATAEEENHGKK